MASRFDIRVELHFQGRDGLIDSEVVSKLLDVIETAVYDSDRSDIMEAARHLDIRLVERDASLERLRRYRQRRLLLEEARPGSLALIGLIAAVSYFVLEKTLGESFTEGYKDSESHRRLKIFFCDLIDRKVLFIAESIRRVIASRKVQAQVRVLPPADESSPHLIFIDVSPMQDHRGMDNPPPLGKALE